VVVGLLRLHLDPRAQVADGGHQMAAISKNGGPSPRWRHHRSVLRSPALEGVTLFPDGGALEAGSRTCHMQTCIAGTEVVAPIA